MTRRRTLLIALVAALFGCALAGTAAWRLAAAPAIALDGTPIGTGASAPDIALVDQNGAPFRFSRERGKELVLFFGFAHCTDVCPETMAKLAQVEHRLGDAARNVRVAFVTVDPARDTVSALKTYVDRFDPRFYGLTGTPHALGAVYAAYHVWYKKVPNARNPDDYDMEHSSAIYLLDRTGRLRDIHDWQDPTADLVHDMRALAAG